MMTLEFPQVFHTGVVPEGTDKMIALAWALQAWGHCMMGAKQPELFGQGMVAIGDLFPGEPMTPEGCMALSKRLRVEKIPQSTIIDLLDSINTDLKSILEKVKNMSGVGIDIRHQANAALTKIEIFKERQAV